MATRADAAIERPEQDLGSTNGIWVDRITGSYRRISAYQLALAWWCYRERHITKRQLRVWFAAQEMAERRRYTKSLDASGQEKRKPSYGIDEIQSLVGGRGSKTARAELSVDVQKLASVGLVVIGERSISFAESVGNLDIEDADGFSEMLGMLPHERRVVPVPRRILRALAGGLTTGMAAVVLATLIRSLFWHKGKGAYRVDGRTKREWIVRVFGVSERSVTEARARLIDLGWLVPLDTPQWMLNRHGAHDRINTDWSAGENGGGENANDNAGESASPQSDSRGGSASPDQNRFSSSSMNLETRTSAPTRAGPSGASRHTRGRRDSVSSKKKRRCKPYLRNVQRADLADTDRLLELHRQAVDRELSHDCEAGKLEFVAMAERARRRGRRAGALFLWLLRERRSEFITHSEEEEAARRLREHREGPVQRHLQGTDMVRGSEQPSQHHEDITTVRVCIQVARQCRIDDPYRVAWRYKGWTRDRWDVALERHEEQQWSHAAVIAAGGGE